jgi:gliding motility-associated-like protein
VARDCEGAAQQISFSDKSTLTPGDFIPDTSYYYDFGGYGFSRAKDTAIVFPSDGIYTISHLVTTQYGCQAIFTKTVEVSPRPVARFIYLNNSTAGFGAIVNFRDTSSNAVRWNWDFGNSTSSQVKNPVVDYNSNGTYTVQLTVADVYSCTSSFSLEVKVINIVNEIIKLIPNMVSPNGDGKNDYWRLDFIDVYFPQADIQIFNRWGEQIFYSKGYSNAWDGSYKGQPLPVGAYYYTIQLNDGVSETIKGSITLLK